MLQIYFKAENLKFKRTLFRKLVWLIPAALILSSIVLMYVGMGLGGFSSVVVCNWCMPMASLTVVFLCHLVNRKDQKHQYRTLYSLPINLRKTFISKTLLIALNLLCISLLIAVLNIVTEWISSGAGAALHLAGYYILGHCLLWLSLLWQIPFCLFLDQKMGFAGSVVLNLFASVLGGAFLYLTPLFWLFPYSWPARLMATLFGVLTNGLLVSADSRVILSPGQCLLLVVTALAAAGLLTILFSRWYRKQVDRK